MNSTTYIPVSHAAIQYSKRQYRKKMAIALIKGAVGLVGLLAVSVFMALLFTANTGTGVL